MTRHVDAETLARYRQDDLRRRRASRIRAHLAGCGRCRALDEDLAGVTALLADVQPPPMPEHLAARIQTALAAEAARRVTLPTGDTGTATAGARTGSAGTAAREATAAPGGRAARHERPRPGRRQPWLPRLSSPVALRTMAAAAVVVVLAGGGYEIARHVGGSSASRTSASAPAARQPISGPNQSASAASGGALPQRRYLRAGHQYVPLVASGTNYAPATLTGQVRYTLAQYGPLARSGPSGANSPLASSPPEPFLDIPVSTLTGCITRIAAGQQALLVDVARYQGRPAIVIVTRASAGGPEQVWVVGRGCSRASRDLLTHATVAPAG